jgi:hypothetical protein
MRAFLFSGERGRSRIPGDFKRVNWLLPDLLNSGDCVLRRLV